VCLLSYFINVYVQAKGFMDVQTQVLGGVDVVYYMSVDGKLGL
jgi:hypothetical protein